MSKRAEVVGTEVVGAGVCQYTIAKCETPYMPSYRHLLPRLLGVSVGKFVTAVNQADAGYCSATSSQGTQLFPSSSMFASPKYQYRLFLMCRQSIMSIPM